MAHISDERLAHLERLSMIRIDDADRESFRESFGTITAFLDEIDTASAAVSAEDGGQTSTAVMSGIEADRQTGQSPDFDLAHNVEHPVVGSMVRIAGFVS